MFSMIPECLQGAWRAEGAEHFIAQVELAGITTGVALGRVWVQHRDVIRLVDNSAALAPVVCGKPPCPTLLWSQQDCSAFEFRS